MSQKGKVNVKERFTDGEIDLSMSDLEEVPVKEIAALKKTHSLDLSNNRITALPKQFTTLTFLTKLDLSKNELTELPEDFGSLSKLRHLDLYRNKLERLPLSFSQLGALKFLDLKDNPLVPAIAKVAGPCTENKECQKCAKDIVIFFKQLQAKVDSEVEMRNKARQKQLEINQQKKQEEKKKLKKEKQNNKTVNKDSAVLKENTNGVNATKKKNKKEQKVKMIQKDKKSHLLLYLFILSVIFVWFLFAFNVPPTQNLAPKISEYYTVFLGKLPPDYRKYGLSLSDSIVMLSDKTRSISTHYFQAISGSEIVRDVVTKINDFVENVKK